VKDVRIKSREHMTEGSRQQLHFSFRALWPANLSIEMVFTFIYLFQNVKINRLQKGAEKRIGRRNLLYL